MPIARWVAQWISAWVRNSPWMTPERRLQWFPAFRAMSVRVIELSEDWRQVRICLPLNRFNQNPGGGMFGGAIAAVADPIAPLVCNRVFPGHQVWTRALQLDFRVEGRTDLELRFALDAQQERRVREELQRRGRATPSFEFGFFDAHGRQCVHVVNTVAIRPIDYQPPGGKQSE